MDRTWNAIVRGIVCAGIILHCASALPAVEFAGGTGTPDDPYQIATAEQLIAIGSDADLLDKHFILLNDIDLDPNLPGGRVFFRSLIAPEFRSNHGWLSGYFQGVFDGGGHVIRNLVIHTERGPSAGLFGYVDSPAQIRNLGLEGVEIRRSLTGPSTFAGGGLVAVNNRGSILGCYVIGSVVENNGHLPRADETRVSAYDRIGGLIGENHGLVYACYALMSLRGDGIVGGLVGYNAGAIHFSFAAGALYGSGWVGGLVGRSDTGSALHSFWDAETSGLATGDEGVGKTSAAMMSRQTYEPWVHTGAWTLDDANDHPRLVWERAPGAQIGDVPPSYGGGSGRPDDPYQIHTVEHFTAIGHRPWDFDKSFALMADLDFAGVDCSYILPIGLEHLAFSGRFDGRSHSLSNLTIIRPDGRCVGVFGVVGPPNAFPHGQTVHYRIEDEDRFGWGSGYKGSRFASPISTWTASIRNLHLHGVTVVGQEYVGGLIGLGQATVEDCSFNGEVTGLSLVGGLIGRALGGAFFRCAVDANVCGEFAVGGLVGATWLGRGLALYDCQASGIVMGQLHTGGLIGFSQGISKGMADSINRCGVSCDVQGRYFTGGCFGSTTGSTTTMSYARGRVTGESWVGGFAGQVVTAAISDSYSMADVAGTKKVGGFAGRCYRGQLARCYAASSAVASDTDWPCSLAGAFVSHVGTLNDRCVDSCVLDVSACFWDAELSDPIPAIGNCPLEPANLAGLTTTQMQTAATFIEAGWDFENVWTICEGRDYPRFRWEFGECEMGL